MLRDEILTWMPFTSKKLKAGPSWYVRHTCTEVHPDFWDVWRDSKDELRNMGFRVRKEDDSFIVERWDLCSPDGDTQLDAPAERRDWILPNPNAELLTEPARRILDARQVGAAATLLESLLRSKMALDGSDTGEGKTYIAAAVAASFGFNVAVVCPANAVTKWTNTLIDVFDVEPEFVASYERLRLASHDSVRDFVSRLDSKPVGKAKKITTTFTWHAVDDVLIIFDEIHHCSNATSLNSRLLLAAIRNPHIKILGLSATAALDPRQLDVIGLGLGLHDGHWWDWALRNGCTHGMFGGLEFGKTPNHQAHLRKIHEQIYPKRGARLRKASSGAKPRVELFDLEYDHAPVQRKIEALERKAECDEITALTLHARERQRTELGKVWPMMTKALDLLDEGYACPIFFKYSQSIELAEEFLASKKIRWRKFVGGGKSEQQRIDFQKGLAQILLVQLDAGSAVVDMHDEDGRFPRALLVSPDFNPKTLIQCIGRVDRRGSKSQALQLICFGNSNDELAVAKAVQQKLDNLAMLNDADLSALRVTPQRSA